MHTHWTPPRNSAPDCAAPASHSKWNTRDQGRRNLGWRFHLDLWPISILNSSSMPVCLNLPVPQDKTASAPPQGLDHANTWEATPAPAPRLSLEATDTQLVVPCYHFSGMGSTAWRNRWSRSLIDYFKGSLTPRNVEQTESCKKAIITGSFLVSYLYKGLVAP